MAPNYSSPGDAYHAYCTIIVTRRAGVWTRWRYLYTWWRALRMGDARNTCHWYINLQQYLSSMYKTFLSDDFTSHPVLLNPHKPPAARYVQSCCRSGPSRRRRRTLRVVTRASQPTLFHMKQVPTTLYSSSPASSLFICFLLSSQHLQQPYRYPPEAFPTYHVPHYTFQKLSRSVYHILNLCFLELS